MKMRPKMPTDIVYDAAMKIVEDCMSGLDAIVQDMVQYNIAFVNMAKALRDVKRNLERHALNKKWTTKENRSKLRGRIRQISTAMALNIRMSVICATTLNSVLKTVGESKKSDHMAAAFESYKNKREAEKKEDDKGEKDGE